jgi:5-methylthioadenosine/S-adenosylhomocysteine deaminase
VLRERSKTLFRVVVDWQKRIMGSKGIFDIVIEGGTLLTMVEGKDPLPNSRICISGDMIEDVSIRENGPVPEANVVIQAEAAIILPGLVNAHGHSPMTIFRGLADDLALKTWLFDRIFPAEAKYLNPDSVYWGCLLACLEMIASGTTTAVDSYFFADEIVRAADRAGIRALVAQGVIDFPAPGVPDPKKNLDVGAAFLERWIGFSDLITPGLFCHSPVTCSENTLREACDISHRFGLPMQTHLSETQEEADEIRKKAQAEPAFYLDGLGVLDGNLIAAHAVHVSDEEIDLLSRREVKVAHCPESNMKLGSGIAPVAKMLTNGVTVGLGTDGCASNNNLDLLREMDTAAKLAKVAYRDPTLLDAESVVRMATIGGAHLIGLENTIGTIEEGKKADIVVISTDTPHMTPTYNPHSQLVYAASGADVRDVIINGRVVYRDRQFTTLDIHEIFTNIGRICREIA